MCYSVMKSRYFRANEEAAEPDPAEAAKGLQQEVLLDRK